MEEHAAVDLQTSEPPRKAAYNDRGIIAEHYRDLQGLPVLDAARASYPLPKASAASATRSVFQAAEIALLNLADLMKRAAKDMVDGRTDLAAVKLSWARGFHRVLVRISLMPQQFGLGTGPAASEAGRLRISDSPAFLEYLEMLELFDRATLARIDTGTLDLRGALADESLASADLILVHAARVANHESTIWEENLADVPAGAVVPSYEQFVASPGMRAAVYDRVLTGDTYFTQFRGLHQIPETLGEEANDHTEEAIRAIRAGRLHAAVDHLRAVTVLADGMLAALPPMADNLATSDYHEIRENLGLTSGSHSVCLRFHMFTDLYHQLSDALRLELEEERAAREAPDESAAWLRRRLVTECLTFRSFIFQWRDQHLHMPRNNLGGASTKSLTGSPDAVLAVKKMRRAARVSDPMIPLAHARGLAAPGADAGVLRLRAYLESDASLDARVLVTTGEVTQSRFVNVQERLGYFSNRCPFSPPAPRRV